MVSMSHPSNLNVDPRAALKQELCYFKSCSDCVKTSMPLRIGDLKHFGGRFNLDFSFTKKERRTKSFLG